MRTLIQRPDLAGGVLTREEQKVFEVLSQTHPLHGETVVVKARANQT